MAFHLHTKENSHFLIPEWFQGAILPVTHGLHHGPSWNDEHQAQGYIASRYFWGMKGLRWNTSIMMIYGYAIIHMKLLAQCLARSSNSSINVSYYFWLIAI